MQQHNSFLHNQVCAWFLHYRYFTFMPRKPHPKIAQWDNLLDINNLCRKLGSWLQIMVLRSQSAHRPIPDWLTHGVTSLLCTGRAPGDTFLISDWWRARLQGLWLVVSLISRSDKSLRSWSPAQCQDDGFSSNINTPFPHCALLLSDIRPGSRFVRLGYSNFWRLFKSCQIVSISIQMLEIKSRK